MKKLANGWKSKALAYAIVLALPGVASADQAYDELRKQVDLLQKQLQQVQETLKRYEQQSATKAEVNEVKQEVRAAAEWKDPSTLIHMAGYADVGYTDAENVDGSFAVGQFSPIFHFQYRDLVMLEAELEFEVEDDGSTNVALEYLTADLFLNDYVTIVGGKFLSPVGQFRQNLHPSWINKLPAAPPGFGHDGAAPVSDLGLMVRGGFPAGGMRANYAAYVSNGPSLNSVTEDGIEFELEGIVAEGFGADADGEKVVGGRLGLLPIPGLEFGVSGATGKASVMELDNELIGIVSELEGEQARDYDVLGADFAWQHKSLRARGEYVQSEVGAASTGVTSGAGSTWETWYAQVAYRFLPTKFEGVVRYTDFDSPHASESQRQVAIGANWLFASSVIGKLAYEFNDNDTGSLADDNRLLLQFAYGF